MYERMNKLVEILGRLLINFFSNFFTPVNYAIYRTPAVKRLFTIRQSGFKKLFYKEIYQFGVLTLPSIMIFSIILSILIVILIPGDGIDFEGVYGNLFFTIAFRELSPLITSFIVIIRGAIYVTIEISQLKIGRSVETLEIMGINPIYYLGIVRIFAGIIVLPVLSLYFSSISFFSGMFVFKVFYNVSFVEYISNIISSFKTFDVIIYLLKCLLSGYLIFEIAVYNGLAAKYEKDEIVKRTVISVVVSSAAVLILNFLFTVFIYGP